MNIFLTFHSPKNTLIFLIIPMNLLCYINVNINGIFKENNNETLFQMNNIVLNILNTETCTTINYCLITLYAVTLLFLNEEAFLSL